MVGNDAAPTLEQLQDLLLESPGFSEFLLGLTAISASMLGPRERMLCAITVEHNESPATVASSTDAAKRLDEKQYAFDDGPCLTALRHQRTVLIGDLNADKRWGHYAKARLGVFDEATVAAVEEHAATISKTFLDGSRDSRIGAPGLEDGEPL